MNTEQLKKMSVKHAAQTMSTSVGTEVIRLAKNKGLLSQLK